MSSHLCVLCASSVFSVSDLVLPVTECQLHPRNWACDGPHSTRAKVVFHNHYTNDLLPAPRLVRVAIALD